MEAIAPALRSVAVDGKTPIECSWWEHTGEMTPFKDGVSSPLYRPLGFDGPCVPYDGMPPGACWVLNHGAGEHPAWAVGADGLAIAVILPTRHSWYIDSRASNCTMPDDKVHKCWIRHGTVGERLTVDKRGLTCKAGAGSIQVPGYHGFLEDGRLVLRRGQR